ncbi:MAG: hypothetical protein ACI9YH_004671 [Colwellia sp.]|jgi:hypothetical protein
MLLKNVSLKFLTSIATKSITSGVNSLQSDLGPVTLILGYLNTKNDIL